MAGTFFAMTTTARAIPAVIRMVFQLIGQWHSITEGGMRRPALAVPPGGNARNRCPEMEAPIPPTTYGCQVWRHYGGQEWQTNGILIVTQR